MTIAIGQNQERGIFDLIDDWLKKDRFVFVGCDPRSFLTVKSKPKPNHDGERRWIYRYFVRKCTVTVSPLISASFYHDAFSNAAREPDLIQ
jgi:hypothetical protein